MAFEHQISITSLTGAGSSSLLTALKSRLRGEPYRWFSGGQLFRELAAKCGMTVEQFTAYCRDHPEGDHDRKLDNQIRDHAKADYMVCEGRLPHFFMPYAYKVILICTLGTRAVRRHRDRPESTLRQVLEEIKLRDRNDRERYALIYPGCIWRPSQFDLIISSDDVENGGCGTPNVLADLLVQSHENWMRIRSRASA